MQTFLSAWLIWFILGAGLALLELTMPGLIVIFMAIGCWIVAGILLIWPLTITQQILIFTIATIASIVLLRKWLIKIFKGSSKDSSVGFDDFPQGVHVRVVRPITPQANGRISYRGTLWDASADELIEKGETVKIVRYADNSRQIYFVEKI